ncbi:MAG: iron-containing alcohol dehydrogenase [Bacteroidia bacterium]|nr:iron-containing alcohol dehydrogenase [Bacteroidia bacterium]
MVGSFLFSPPPGIIFGLRTISRLPDIIAGYGKSVLFLTGSASFIHTREWGDIQEKLTERKVRVLHEIIESEPSPEMIDRCVEKFRGDQPSVVVAIGGGSVLDAGKAVSAMFAEVGSITDYLEGVGTKKPSGAKIPFVAIPTTAGTGSEATKNAVISRVGKNGFKKSLRHDRYIPDLALIDPELTVSCSPRQTACSGMDAFTQLLESYVSTKATPLTDTLALEGLRHIQLSLIPAWKNGGDREARSGMAYAALLSGITLANAGLGLVHGFAGVIGGWYPIPHGVICGSLMGVVNQAASAKILADSRYAEAKKKYANVGRIFSEDNGKKGEAYYVAFLAEEISNRVEEMKIPRLSAVGIKETDLARIAEAPDLKNHPVSHTTEELENMLRLRL